MDLSLKGGIVVSSLIKGQEIIVNCKKYYVKSITKKRLTLKNDLTTVTIKINKNFYYGNTKTESFFRDIESDLVLDSINKTNPFNIETDSTKIFKKTWKN
jgi:hypothetical protein